MPVRFTTPSLGGQGELQAGDLLSHQWRIELGYRHLHADQAYVGTQLVPTNEPLIINLNSVDLTTRYAVTDHLALSLTIPFVSGMQSRYYGDSLRHAVSASGVGDMSLLASMWLRAPHGHAANAALGVGVKLPTGAHAAADDYFLSSGQAIRYPVDQSIQPGDGGWGYIVQVQTFATAFHNAVAYLSGSYLINPRKLTDVAKDPGSKVFWSVPDAYTSRAGLAFAFWPNMGMSANLGARIDGQPVRDLIGGADGGFRRPGYSVAVDPGLAVALGPNEITLNAPIRVVANRQASVLDRSTGKHGGGDFAASLIFVGYAVRY